MSKSWVENTSKHIQSLGMELVVTVTRENERSLALLVPCRAVQSDWCHMPE